VLEATARIPYGGTGTYRTVATEAKASLLNLEGRYE